MATGGGSNAQQTGKIMLASRNCAWRSARTPCWWWGTFTRANLERFGIDLGPDISLIGPQACMALLHLWHGQAAVRIVDVLARYRKG